MADEPRLTDVLAKAQSIADQAIEGATALREHYSGQRVERGGALTDSVGQALLQTYGALRAPLDEDLQPFANAIVSFPITLELLIQVQTLRLLRKLTDAHFSKLPTPSTADGS